MRREYDFSKGKRGVYYRKYFKGKEKKVGVKQTKLGMTVSKPKPKHWDDLGTVMESGAKGQKGLLDQDPIVRGVQVRRGERKLPKVTPNPDRDLYRKGRT